VEHAKLKDECEALRARVAQLELATAGSAPSGPAAGQREPEQGREEGSESEALRLVNAQCNRAQSSALEAQRKVEVVLSALSDASTLALLSGKNVAAEMQQTIDQLHFRISEQENLLARKDAAIASSLNELDTQKQRTASAEDKAAAPCSRCATLSEEVAQWQSIQAQAMLSSTESRKELESVTEQSKLQLDMMQELEAKLRNKTRDCEALEEQLKDRDGEVSTLKAAAVQNEERASEEIRVLEQAKAQAEEMLADSMSRFKSVATRSKTELERLKAKKDELQLELAETKKNLLSEEHGPLKFGNLTPLFEGDTFVVVTGSSETSRYVQLQLDGRAILHGRSKDRGERLSSAFKSVPLMEASISSGPGPRNFRIGNGGLMTTFRCNDDGQAQIWFQALSKVIRHLETAKAAE